MPKLNKTALLSMIFHIAKGVIKGRTRLHKIIFLVQKEFSIGDFTFKPHVFGPYSPELDQLLENLIKDELIATKDIVDPTYSFLQEKPTKVFIASKKLLEIGSQAYKELYDTDCIMALLLTRRVKGYMVMPITRLLAYIYAKYPEFSINSMIKEKVDLWRKFYKLGE